MASPEKPDRDAGNADENAAPMKWLRRHTKELLAAPLSRIEKAERLCQIEQNAILKKRKSERVAF